MNRVGVIKYQYAKRTLFLQDDFAVFAECSAFPRASKRGCQGFLSNWDRKSCDNSNTIKLVNIQTAARCHVSTPLYTT